jgi:hypothetical protein
MERESYRDLEARWKRLMDEAMSSPECFFAFDEGQLEDGLARAEAAGIKREAFAGAGLGMVCTDTWFKEDFLPLVRRHAAERLDAMRDPAFALEAFECEMENHEFGLTGDDAEVLACLGLEARPDAHGAALYDVATGERLGDEVLKAYATAADRTRAHERKPTAVL